MKFTPRDWVIVLAMGMLMSACDLCFGITNTPRQMLTKFIGNIIVAIIIKAGIKAGTPAPKGK